MRGGAGGAGLLVLLGAFPSEAQIEGPPKGSAVEQASWASKLLVEGGDPLARGAAWRVLVGLGGEALPVLAEALDSPAWALREAALDAYATSGLPVPVEALRARLADPNRRVRAAALRAAREPADLPIEGLRASLRDPLFDVRREALRAALRLYGDRAGAGAEGAAAEVAHRLLDPDSDVREEAFRVLVAWGEAGAEVLAAHALRSWSPFTHRALSRLAAGDPSEALVPALRRLAADAGEDDSRRAFAAAVAAIAGDATADLDDLATAFLAETGDAVREAAANALRLRGREGADALEGGLLSGEHSDRFEAGLALLEVCDPRGLPARVARLLGATPVERGEDRALLYGFFSPVPPPSFFERVLEEVRHETRPRARAAGIAALSRFGGLEAAVAAAEHFGDPDARVRSAALRAAGSLAGDHYARAIAAGIRAEQDAEARRDLVENASRWTRSPEVRDALVAALREEVGDIREAAVASLSRFRRDPAVVAALEREHRRSLERERGAGPLEREALRDGRRRLLSLAGIVGGESAFAFLAGVLEASAREEAEREVASVAAFRLASFEGGAEALRPFLDREGVTRRVRAEVALALASRGDPEARRLLFGEFSRLDAALRDRAVRAIGADDAGESVAFLVAVATDGGEETAIRETAFGILARHAGREAVRRVLIEGAMEESDSSARLAAIRALGECGSDPCVGALRALLPRPDAIAVADDAAVAVAREVVGALRRSFRPEAAADLAAIVFARPLARWREDLLRDHARGPSAAFRFDLEGTALEALSGLGETGAEALVAEARSLKSQGRLFLLDAGFLRVLGEGVHGFAPGTAARALRLAAAYLREVPSMRLAALVQAGRAAEDAERYGEAAEAFAAAWEAVRLEEVGARGVRAALGEEDPQQGRSPRRRLRVRVLLTRGMAALASGDEAAGARAFDAALAAAGRDPVALSDAAVRLSKFPATREKALEVARAIVAFVPEARRSHETLGWCLLSAGDAAGALAAFEVASSLPVEEGRDEEQAALGLAAALAASGREEEALSLLREAVARSPSSVGDARRIPALAALVERWLRERGGRSDPK